MKPPSSLLLLLILGVGCVESPAPVENPPATEVSGIDPQMVQSIDALVRNQIHDNCFGVGGATTTPGVSPCTDWVQ